MYSKDIEIKLIILQLKKSKIFIDRSLNLTVK